MPGYRITCSNILGIYAFRHTQAQSTKLTDKLISFDEDHTLPSRYATDLSGTDAVRCTDFITAIGEENNFSL